MTKRNEMYELFNYAECERTYDGNLINIRTYRLFTFDEKVKNRNTNETPSDVGCLLNREKFVTRFLHT